MAEPEKTIEEKHREQLIKSYQQAGHGYLAFRLQRVFTRIDTDEDRILHNDMLKEILLMIETDPAGFVSGVANVILQIAGKGRN